PRCAGRSLKTRPAETKKGPEGPFSFSPFCLAPAGAVEDLAGFGLRIGDLAEADLIHLELAPAGNRLVKLDIGLYRELIVGGGVEFLRLVFGEIFDQPDRRILVLCRFRHPGARDIDMRAAPVLVRPEQRDLL